MLLKELREKVKIWQDHKIIVVVEDEINQKYTKTCDITREANDHSSECEYDDLEIKDIIIVKDGYDMFHEPKYAVKIKLIDKTGKLRMGMELERLRKAIEVYTKPNEDIHGFLKDFLDKLEDIYVYHYWGK